MSTHTPSNDPEDPEDDYIIGATMVGVP
jgi:hypothetical protein